MDVDRTSDPIASATDAVKRLTVVAAVVRDAEGRILLCRRPQGTHMAGLWEFPGGKVEPGERLEQALARELDEELGIEVDVGRPLTFAVHREPRLEILLLFFAAEISAGTPSPREGQDIAWVSPCDIASYEVPPADAALVEELAR